MNGVSAPLTNDGLGDAAKKEKILELAFDNAVKKTAIMTLGAAAATAAVAYRYKNFNKFTSLSIKLAIPTMTLIGTFSYVYETTVTDAIHHPERYGITEEVIQQKAKVSSLPVHHRFLNYIYDHPFQMVGALGVPLAGTILSQQMHNTHLTLSQKIMHSRVFAQGGVLSILLLTMAFREYMDRRGRFGDEEDEDDE